MSFLLKAQNTWENFAKYKIKNSTKFVEEIFWRVYWKGWMENRPKVWRNFISENNLEFDYELYDCLLYTSDAADEE